MNAFIPSRRVRMVLLLSVLCACGSTTTRVSKTMHDADYRNATFSNVLVVAVSANYDARAQFERSVASGIRQTGARSKAYYTVVGHNPTITLDMIRAAIAEGGHDAVLFTQVKGSSQQLKVKDGPSDAQATAKGGSVVDLFRYNYEEFTEPENITVSSNVVLITELYDASAEKKVWSVESSSFDRESIAQIVDGAAESIVSALRRDSLVGT